MDGLSFMASEKTLELRTPSTILDVDKALRAKGFDPEEWDFVKCWQEPAVYAFYGCYYFFYFRKKKND